MSSNQDGTQEQVAIGEPKRVNLMMLAYAITKAQRHRGYARWHWRRAATEEEKRRWWDEVQRHDQDVREAERRYHQARIEAGEVQE